MSQPTQDDAQMPPWLATFIETQLKGHPFEERYSAIEADLDKIKAETKALGDQVSDLTMIFKTQHIKMRIVGFTGRAGSGKDTSAAILAGMSDARRVRSTAFVEPLKNAAQILFGFSQDQLYVNKEKEDPRWGKSPRQILQWLGTDVLREQVDKDFFIKHMQMRIDKAKKQGMDLFIITDVRFDNEAEFVLSQGGLVVHLERAGAEPVAEHVSEHGVSAHLITHRIANHGTLEDLERAVYALFETPFSMYALEDSLPSD